MHVDGEIGYYGLGEWWATELTEAERTRLEDIFHPNDGLSQSTATHRR